MKYTIIIILIILIFSITACYFSHKFIHNNGRELSTQLDELKSDLLNKNKDKALTKANNIYNKWNDSSSKWAIIVQHQELDYIEKEMTEMNANIHVDEFYNAYVSLEKVLFYINHLIEKENFSIKNVF